MRGRSKTVLVPKARMSVEGSTPAALRTSLRKGVIQGTTRSTQSFGAKAKKSWIMRRPRVRVAVGGQRVNRCRRWNHLAAFQPATPASDERADRRKRLTGISAEVESVDSNLGLSRTIKIRIRTSPGEPQNDRNMVLTSPSPFRASWCISSSLFLACPAYIGGLNL